jgi:hypothetical protein
MGLFSFAGEARPDEADLPFLAGTNLVYYWSQVEPRKGHIDFDRIDRDIAPWAARGKLVCLRFSSAGWAKWSKPYSQQGTPQWVYDQGVASVTEDDGSRLPVYWDPNYLKELEAFVAALGRHYDGNPTVAYIQIAVGDGGETLADTHSRNPQRPALWQAVGYTDQTWWSTLQRIVGLYQKSFSHTPLALMIDSTFLGKTKGLNFHTVSAWAAEQGLWLQDNGLTSKRVYNDTWASAIHLAEPLYAADKNGSTLRQDLQRAIELKVRYLLVFRQDIYKPENRTDLLWAAGQAGK